MEDFCCERGLAFIVEGATEKVLYHEYLKYLCSKSGHSTISKNEDSQEDQYTITSKGANIIVMFNSVNTVSQMTNSATWFQRACVKVHPDTSWSVLFCYDTDEYNCPITKFHEGDWIRLRKDIERDASTIIDLAAEADMEDILLCDYPGILWFLGLPVNTPMPNGGKGKTKLKKLYRMVAPNKSYHPGEKARSLIQSLNMSIIEEKAPIPLKAISEALNIN